MATSRRAPARPAAGGGTTRRPAARRSRSAARAASAATRPRAVVEEGAAATTAGGRPRRPSVTGRAAVLALVLAVLLVSYVYPLRAWFDQHRERTGLEREAAELETSVEQLEQERRLWEDPAYVAAMARERLSFVLPGEQGYVVVPGEPDDEAVDGDGLPPASAGPWYQRLWASVQAADAPPPEDEGE